MSMPNQPTDGGTGEVARHHAEHLKNEGSAAVADVAGTAKEKASEITSDLREQTRRLAWETRDQVNGELGQQRDRAVQGLRGMSDEFRTMAEHGQSGWGSQLARQGADWSDQLAGFLQDRDLGDIFDDVRQMARRRPGRFLLGAVAAGVVAGRLSRALASSNGKQEEYSRPSEWSANGVRTPTGAGVPAGTMPPSPGGVTTTNGDLGVTQPEPGAPVRPGVGR